MKRVPFTSLALVAVFSIGTVAIAAKGPQPVQQVRTFALAADERAAILPLQLAVEANNYAAAAAALPGAQRAASSADARYYVAQYQLRISLATNNMQMQSQAIDAILASGGAPAADLPQLYANQAALAAAQGDLRKAETSFARLLELTPNDAETAARLAEVKNDLGKIAESATLIERAIALREASGQPVPEGWYKRALKIAYDAKIAPQSLHISRKLVMAYPNGENWRDAIRVYRDMSASDKESMLDLLRLKRVSHALHGERDYYEFISWLNSNGLPLEAKAVFDEGVAQRVIDPTKTMFKDLSLQLAKRTAAGKSGLGALQSKAMAAASGVAALGAGDSLFGAGDYTAAAELYRAALRKGAVDPNVVNIRLGEALAEAGRQADAALAFQAVSGNRSDLAALWLVWLGQRG